MAVDAHGIDLRATLLRSPSVGKGHAEWAQAAVLAAARLGIVPVRERVGACASCNKERLAHVRYMQRGGDEGCINAAVYQEVRHAAQEHAASGNKLTHPPQPQVKIKLG